jgi:uncharacterized protein (TIGR03086 family)
MTAPVDLEPAARRMAWLIEAVPADALGQPTPCGHNTVGDLLDHISGSALAFRAAAEKQPLPGGPAGNAANLPSDWQARLRGEVLGLAEAWHDPEAWTGMTAAGGIDLPGEIAGVVALDELVIHGWDLAKAIGQPAGYDGPGLEAVLGFVEQFPDTGTEGLFGPAVSVPPEAPLLERIVGRTGRDPAWEPPE